MAIGDTVQAGLLRADFSPIQKAGQAQAQANQAFGQTLGGLVDKFYQKKKEKAEKEQLKQAYLKLGMSEEVADAAKNDKDLAGQFINKMNADRNYDLQMDQFNQVGELRDLQKDQIAQNMARQEDADQLKDEKRMVDNQFMQSLMSQTTSPQAQRQADIAMPGLPALGNADARNRFMQAQLQQPQNQVPVSNLGSQDFGRFAREQGLDPTRSVQRMEALRQSELANQPKALSPSDQLAREKYEDKKAEDVQETETAKVESTNNLTDFYNETKSLLDKINEKGVDVTGPIEGTSIYRFFSKLGDTNDEQVRRRLEMFTRKLTLDAAQNLKGALSDKDIRFLVEQAPDMDDNPSVWKKYMGDLVLRLERNANQQGIELGVSQADLSTPADQSTLDEIERKKQLRSKRAGL